MARRSPQEKKRLSYAKDRRNAYGENDKSSRKNIPRSRQRAHRASRRVAATILHAATGRPDESVVEVAEQRLLGTRPRTWRWRKSPDFPLGEYLEYTLRRRQQREPAESARLDDAIRRIRKRQHLPTRRG